MSKRFIALGPAVFLMIACIALAGCHQHPDNVASGSSTEYASAADDLLQAVLDGSVKTETSHAGEDYDLKLALLVTADLPAGWVNMEGDVRMTADTPDGSIRILSREFEVPDTTGFPQVISMAISGLAGKRAPFRPEEEKIKADMSGLFQSTEALDTSRIGEDSTGMRGIIDNDVHTRIVWNRRDVTYTLNVVYPEDFPDPPDALSLAGIMDRRASVEAPIPTTAAGVEGLSYLFGGSEPRVEFTSEEPDPQLVKSLLSESDLPNGFLRLMGDGHLVVDLPSGATDMAYRMFMRQEEGGDATDVSMIVSYAFSASLLGVQMICDNANPEVNDQFRDAERLDTAGLGETGCGIRTASGDGTLDWYLWSREGRDYSLVVYASGDAPPLDGLKLANVMDYRAR